MDNNRNKSQFRSTPPPKTSNYIHHRLLLCLCQSTPVDAPLDSPWGDLEWSLPGRLLLRINLSLLLAPEANIANDGKEEQDTVIE